MRPALKTLSIFLAVFAVLLALHAPLLRLPYFWDETGYYIPAARDFYKAWLLIPKSTLPVGHTPLVMVYLGLAWRLFGFSTVVARTAMTLIAAATVTLVYGLGRRVASAEVAAWSALLLALSPLFFAQNTLAHLDLAAGLFTTLTILFLLENHIWLFALAASLAILSKETSAILLPVAWVFAWRRWRKDAGGRGGQPSNSAALVSPLLPLAAWAVYYHHVTGYWTGNASYLSYNLYSTLSPVRVFLSLLRRLYELFFSGFDWLITAGALAGLWWKRREARNSKLETRNSQPSTSFEFRFSNFDLLAVGLIVVYLLFLSVVGGAILPRYLLAVWPVFFLLAVCWVMRLPRGPARLVLAAAAACFVCAWFINPPYPFPFEDNLAYSDFIKLHEQAARFLQAQPGKPRILTAWPATDELSTPFLGYVHAPLRVVPVQGFTSGDFADVPSESFDLVYLYSRRWEPSANWVTSFPTLLRMQERYFKYHPQAEVETVVNHYHLRLLAEMERRGQWVRIYAHESSSQ